MAKFQLIVSDPVSKTSKAATIEGAKAQALVGRSIGDEVDGKLLGIGNMRLKITGGTDKDGIPMRFDIQGGAKKRAILSGGVGFKPNDRGERRRKLVRGRVVGEDTLQVNSVVMAEAAPAEPKTPAPEKKAEPAKPAQRPVEAKS
ncbi:30S ribosomal protein S6e [Candidatus Bathyarchaeota archaeon]|nr:MAG: 30S ribosomal protein S6e [Candidatus Bathyarchaeota archaeon]